MVGYLLWVWKFLKSPDLTIDTFLLSTNISLACIYLLKFVFKYPDCTFCTNWRHVKSRIWPQEKPNSHHFSTITVQQLYIFLVRPAVLGVWPGGDRRHLHQLLGPGSADHLRGGTDILLQVRVQWVYEWRFEWRPDSLCPGASEPVVVRKCGSVASGAKCLESSIPNDGVFISAWVSGVSSSQWG